MSALESILLFDEPAIDISPDFSKIAVAVEGDYKGMFSSEKWQQIAVLGIDPNGYSTQSYIYWEHPTPTTLFYPIHDIDDGVFSPGGHYFATLGTRHYPIARGSHGMIYFSYVNERRLSRVRMIGRTIYHHYEVNALIFSPDDQYYAAVFNSTSILIEKVNSRIFNGKRILSIGQEIAAMAFCYDNRTLIAGDVAGGITRFDRKTGEKKQISGGNAFDSRILDIVPSPLVPGLIAVLKSSYNDCTLHLIDSKTGEHIAEPLGLRAACGISEICCAFSPKDPRVLAVRTGQTITFLDIAGMRKLQEAFLDIPEYYGARKSWLKFSAEGKRIATEFGIWHINF